jgi:hypothetical protein
MRAASYSGRESHMRRIVLSLIFAASAAVVSAQPADTEAVPTAQTVAWRGPQGDMVLRGSVFFPEQDTNYRAFFMDIRRPRHVSVSTIGRMQIADHTPTFFVQGFGYGTNWELAKLERRHGREEIYLPSRDPWNDKNFFSDEAFAREDLRDVVQSSGGEVYTLRPAQALDAGGYLLCGKPAADEGGWLRVCFDFEIMQ